MAKKASASGASEGSKKRSAPKAKSTAKPGKAVAASRPRASRSGERQSDFNAADALLKLLESPLVADLLAVGATAALAAIAESRYSRKSGADAKSTKALKAAAKAAAAAMGRRIATEFDEIRKASKKTKATEEA